MRAIRTHMRCPAFDVRLLLCCLSPLFGSAVSGAVTAGVADAASSNSKNTSAVTAITTAATTTI